MNRIKRWAWPLAALAAALLLVGLVLAAPGKTAVVEPRRVLPFAAAAPGWVDVQGGTLRLSPRDDGVVVSVAEASDQIVSAGTVLLQMDAQSLGLQADADALALKRQQQAVQALSAQLKLAEAERSRLQPLLAVQAESADVLRQSEAQLQSLHTALQAAELDATQQQLQQRRLQLQRQQLQLRAPQRGRLLRVDAHVGETIGPAAPVLWFAPEAPLIVRAELDERLLGAVQLGMRAEVEAEADDGHVYPAKLIRIASAIGPVRALPEVRVAAKDDHVVECILSLGAAPLLIGQRVIVRFGGAS